MMLEFSATVASRGFDVQLDVATGETLAVLGPNGSGKSTLLGSIAGLVRPDAGVGRLDDRVLFELGADSSGTWLAPHRRGVALLAQKAMLFPRMSVRDNVAFGPQSTGAGTRMARERAARWLDEVEAGEFASRRPTQLSGGQAQRVAIARALATEPRLLLLDEPMAALDVTVTPALRRLLHRVLAGQTAILVTHDVLDAYTLASRVAVMNDGHIVEIGATRDVFERPRSTFTAALVGLNLFTGARTAKGLTIGSGLELVADGSAVTKETSVGGTVSPTAIRVSTTKPDGARANSIEAEVLDLEPRGDFVRVNTGQWFADVAPAVVAELDLVSGSRVWGSFIASELRLYAL